jgi:predicted DNA-binding transcriptional regulator AlpA
MALTDSEIEAVAARVVELLHSPRDSRELVDAREIARRFGISRAYIYDHSEELGAIRLGPGPRARLRFDPAEVGRLLAPSKPRASTPHARKRQPQRKTAALLPIRRGSER